jgi:recombinational DNA repair protein RecR
VYEGVVQSLIDELGRLPGVGPKSAQRIAFHLLAADPADVRRLTEALTEVKDKVRFCKTCGNVAEAEECRICRDARGVQGRRRDREDAGVPRPLPRAGRGHQPDRGRGTG